MRQIFQTVFLRQCQRATGATRTQRQRALLPTTTTRTASFAGAASSHHRRGRLRRRAFSSAVQGAGGGGGGTSACGDYDPTSTTTSSTPAGQQQQERQQTVCWLDLRGSGLSVLERLLLEECLLRHDSNSKEGEIEAQGPRSWILVGHHEPTRNRYLQVQKNVKSKKIRQPAPEDDYRNDNAVIVMGIGGKPAKLLDLPKVRQQQILTLKRFSGGGTVVLDIDSIWTTIIGRKDDFSHVIEPFPRPIMSWSADTVFGPTFQYLKEREQTIRTTKNQQNQDRTEDPTTTTTPSRRNKSNDLIEGRRRQHNRKQTLVPDTKSCATEVSGRVVTVPDDNDAAFTYSTTIPDFELRENDYILGEDRKMGGNAQAIVSSGWLHHTSFLWDYSNEHMDYLTLPDKRPDYRQDKSHDEFLISLQQCYPNLTKADFYTCLKHVCEQQFDLHTVTLPEAMKILKRQGGMQAWFEKGGRTKIVHDL